MRHSVALDFALTLALITFATSVVMAAPGDLDPSFAGTGISRIGLGGGNDIANGIATQADYKLVVVGSSGPSGQDRFLVSRYNTDGSRDTSFGGYGKAITGIGSNAIAYGAAIQTDGKIVAAGFGYGSDNYAYFALVRYNSDGSLDSTFGTGGTVLTQSTALHNSYGRAVVIQSDNKIIVAGNLSGSGYEVARYNSDGSLDSSFNSNGIVIGSSSTNTNGNSVALQSDGKIVVAGGSGVARLNSDGSIDTSFSGNGYFVFSTGFSINAVAIQGTSPQKIVLGGSITSGSKTNFAAARLNLNGSLDTRFGGGTITGVMTTGSDIANAVIVQVLSSSTANVILAGSSSTTSAFEVARFTDNGSGPARIATPIGASAGYASAVTFENGELVVAGSCTNTSSDFALARYNLTNITLDTTFNGTGKKTDDLSDLDAHGKSVVLQADGRIVVAGSANNGLNQDFAVARYNADGSLDPTFGLAGKVTTAIGSGDEVANAVILQGDGKIIAAGSSYNGTDNDFAVARYNLDGTLDSTFGTAGKVTTPIGSQDDTANAIALQPDGKIIVAGTTSNSSSGNFAVVRYNTDGSLDTNFGGTGKVVTAVGSGDNCYAVKVQPDGKIVVAGLTEFGAFEIALARYNANGTLDTSFGSFGRVATPVMAAAAAVSLAIQGDGKIVVAGLAESTTEIYFLVARYNSNGSLDSSFNGNGTAVTSIGVTEDIAYAVALQADGKIVAAGLSNMGSKDDFALVRYNTDGSLDASYGNNGRIIVDFNDGGHDDAYGLAIDSIGRYVLAGDANGLFGVARVYGDTLVKISSITRRGSDGHFILDGLALPGVSNSLKQATFPSSSSFSLLTLVGPNASGNWEVDLGQPGSPHFYELTSP